MVSLKSLLAVTIVPRVEFGFPEGKGKGKGPAKCEPKEAPLEIEVGGSIDLSARVEPHVIPRTDRPSRPSVERQ